jgi:hypothetical protein
MPLLIPPEAAPALTTTSNTQIRGQVFSLSAVPQRVQISTTLSQTWLLQAKIGVWRLLLQTQEKAKFRYTPLLGKMPIAFAQQLAVAMPLSQASRLRVLAPQPLQTALAMGAWRLVILAQESVSFLPQINACPSRTTHQALPQKSAMATPPFHAQSRVKSQSTPSLLLTQQRRSLLWYAQGTQSTASPSGPCPMTQK